MPESSTKDKADSLGKLMFQILQVKNFIGYTGILLSAFLIVYSSADQWDRTKNLFVNFSLIGCVWFIFLVLKYGRELFLRFAFFLVGSVKLIWPIIALFIGIYLIAVPLDTRRMLGAVLFLFGSMAILRSQNKNLIIKRDISKKEKKFLKINQFKKILGENWTATETTNEQGTNFKELPLNGGRISKLKFTLIPAPGFWRAGFKIGSLDTSILPLRSSESFLFHLGSSDVIDRATGDWGIRRWFYIGLSNPKSHDLDSSKSKSMEIVLDINTKNFIHCYINGQLEFKQRFEPNRFEKVYLAAWGDGNPYRVEFKDIEYSIK